MGAVEGDVAGGMPGGGAVEGAGPPAAGASLDGVRLHAGSAVTAIRRNVRKIRVVCI